MNVEMNQHGLTATDANWIATETDEAVLLEGLRSCLSVTLENIRNAAMIVRRWDELSLNRARLESAVPPIILKSLRRIGSGLMLPETFMLLNGVVQDRVGNLPIEEQQLLVTGKLVTVLTDKGPRKLPVDQLTAKDSRLVFDGARIRTADEQRVVLERLGGKPRRFAKAAPLRNPVLRDDGRDLEYLDDGEDDLPNDFEERLAAVRAEKLKSPMFTANGNAIIDATSMTPESSIAFHASQIITTIEAQRSSITTEMVETLRELNELIVKIMKSRGRKL